MKTLSLSKLVALTLILIAGTAAQVFAGVVPHEPTPESGYRALRDGYVRTWYVFNDSKVDGILDPGDTMINTIDNMWTSVSSGTMMTYGDNQGLGAGDDRISAPMNWATYKFRDTPGDPNNVPDYNYWLSREPNTMRFFMSYSQFDNNNWDTQIDSSTDANAQAIVKQRNYSRNGWSLGWTINDYKNDPNSHEQIPAGFVKMQIAVHNGKLTETNLDPNWGPSRSDPQVSMSDDMDHNLGLDKVGEPNKWSPAQWSTLTSSYAWDANDTSAANKLRFILNGHSDPNSVTELANSQELKEANGFNTGLKDHTGVNDYLYQDAFDANFHYVNSATDGGMIAGLGGYNNLNQALSNWGDQQVIRIKIDPNTLIAGHITKIYLTDFGASSPGDPNTGQVNPTTPIVLLADANGMIYMNGPSGVIYFPDNIVYIAESQIIPEPASLGLLIIGGTVVLLKRRYLRD